MTRILLFSTLLIFHPPAHAIDTALVSRERLLELGALLEADSGSSQWQMLWQRVRSSGFFLNQPGQLHFTVSPSQLPAMARLTLARADQVEPFADTHVRYRRGFAPLVVGQRGGQALEALCVDVDWRALPVSSASLPHAYLKLITLRRAYPCD
ncbi:hypothetical protein ACE1YR_10715 [Pseudomonas sp. K1(2024)]|uniref:Uncharacterized protein n=1 Tax=Pseudomonas boreofloridensis TaxID=3064348 RepID=A0ABV4Z8F0_9PSED|nr:hypothetical protein [Pseudomonas sp. K13]MDO7902566.1 hypothetical protein [Pseudomonas sp. K13]